MYRILSSPGHLKKVFSGLRNVLVLRSNGGGLAYIPFGECPHDEPFE